MKSLLLEQFWWLLAVCVVLWVFFAVVFFQRRTVPWRRAMQLAPIVFVVLLAINRLVVTDREAIRGTLYHLVDACVAGDTGALGRWMHDEFSAAGLSKSQLLGQAQQVFQRIRIDSVTLTQLIIEPPGLKAASFAHILGQSGTDYQYVKSDWELKFKKTPQGWMLISVKPISIQNQPVSQITEVINLGLQVE